MNIGLHSVTAIPFVATGQWWAALGCVAPDVTWAWNEIQYRRSSIRPWSLWARMNLTATNTMLYRMAHSVLIVLPICAYYGWWEFFMGWAVHVACDLPTHDGYMRQQPFYPFQWRWQWVIKRFC